jgi:hypothetical protein
MRFFIFRPRMVVVLLGLLAVAILGWAGAFASSAYGERAQAGRFLAAPRCAAGASPAGDCSAWLTRKVSSVSSSKDGWNVDLDGGLNLWYLSGPGWVTGLTAGEPVPVLVWEGSAQAVRDPQGHVLYGENAALSEGFSDISGAVCLSSLALMAVVGGFGLYGWFQRRVVLAVVLVDAGVSGLAGGAVIQSANSVGRGVMVGVIVFCAVGFAAPVVWRFRRPLKLAARA